VIGFGTWRYRGGVEPIRRALELGAALVDTAESYRTEETVGAAIRGVRDHVLLATKVSPRHFRYRDVLAAADGSLRRLGVEYLDLYQLHSPHAAVPIAETMGAMEALVDAGKVRFVGVSNFSTGELRRAQAAMRRHRIVSNQVRYNLIERDPETDLLAYCRDQGITLIAHSPLAHGLERIEAGDPAGVLEKVAAMTGMTKAQVALAWCVTRDQVVAIPKADSIAHVVENCGAADHPLPPEAIALLDRRVRHRRRGRLELALRSAARRVLDRLGLR
jgi:diketogulonate reductase-like aldo/keto reductase